MAETWVVSLGHFVIAGVRRPSGAEKLSQLIAQQPGSERCLVEQCDVTSEDSINNFVNKVSEATQRGLIVNNVVLNAGVLKYPNRATEMYEKLIKLNPDNPPSKVVFISSDSGSTASFRSHEDGFGAYGASKAALNQMLRHMAAELERGGGGRSKTTILAMHPGEVQTDMANVELGWEVDGMIDPPESVEGMLKVIKEKDEKDNGTFWCWDGR
ncbi:hypothetical protein N7526_006134, partial [Penicillium atrosanguineum]